MNDLCKELDYKYSTGTYYCTLWNSRSAIWHYFNNSYFDRYGELL